MGATEGQSGLIDAKSTWLEARSILFSPITTHWWFWRSLVFLIYTGVYLDDSLRRCATFPFSHQETVVDPGYGWLTWRRPPHRRRYQATLSDCKGPMDNPGTLQPEYGLLANWLWTKVCGWYAKEHLYWYLGDKCATYAVASVTVLVYDIMITFEE